MQVAVLDGDGDDEASDEEEVGVGEIGRADGLGGEDAEDGEEEGGHQSRRCQRHHFEHPVGSHDDHAVAACRLLKECASGCGCDCEEGGDGSENDSVLRDWLELGTDRRVEEEERQGEQRDEDGDDGSSVECQVLQQTPHSRYVLRLQANPFVDSELESRAANA